MTTLVQLALGLLFGTGLVVAGMSDPEKVLNFLDLAAIRSDPAPVPNQDDAAEEIPLDHEAVEPRHALPRVAPVQH